MISQKFFKESLLNFIFKLESVDWTLLNVFV